MQNWEATQAMLEEAFSTVLRSLERAQDGGWAMEKESIFGKTNGFQLQLLTK